MPIESASRRSCLVFPLWALAAGLWLGVPLAHDAGWRINYSPSMPIGVWRLHPVAEPFQREQIVSICPPDGAVVRDARRRGYIGKGDCPGGYEPLLKPVAAIPGDVVTVDADGIAVNGRSLTNSAALTVDGRERAIQSLARGTYTVSPGELWLISTFHPASFDSRYFGPVSGALARGIADLQPE